MDKQMILGMLKCRWRNVLWMLLMVVVVLNAAIFLTIPGTGSSSSSTNSKKDTPTNKNGRLERVASHLQVLRKRLTANFNSNSMNHPESSNLDFKGEHILNNDPRAYHGGNDDGDDAGDNRQYDDDNNNNNNQVHYDNGGRNNPTRGDDAHQGQGQGQRPSGDKQYGSRANYSIPEVDDFVKLFMLKYEDSMIFGQGGMEYGYIDLMKKMTRRRTKGARLKAYVNKRGLRAWERFHYGIRQHELYDGDDPSINRMLKDMSTLPIVNVEQKDGGTQIKLMITFEDQSLALFKPMRFPREQETLPDHFYFADYERHISEIASFHLDRILSFNRVPPTVGRLFNMSRDLQPYANSKLAKTFFISPVGNLCFHGQCSYYCDSSHPICGHPVMLEGSLAAFLPPMLMAKRKTWRNPWKRSYSKHRKAYWEVYNDLCLKVRVKSPYNEGRRMMDLLDMSVYDFLIGNLDRHHYETFREFGNDTFLLHMDQGRGFGKSKYDCISCLAPVRQCCMIRLSTLAKLVKMYQGPNSLSSLMRSSLDNDPVRPILTEPHLNALDRRLSKVLHVIDGCLKEGKAWNDVVIDDGVT